MFEQIKELRKTELRGSARETSYLLPGEVRRLALPCTVRLLESLGVKTDRDYLKRLGRRAAGCATYV